MNCRSPLVFTFLLVLRTFALAADETASLPIDLGAASAAPLPVQVAPQDSHLRYAGRFDFSHPGLAISSWSATAVEVRFRGTAINVNLGTGANRFEVIVDGAPAKIITADAFDPHTPPVKWYAAAAGLADSEHTVSIFKRTEASVGDAAFGGFQLSEGASLLELPALPRKILVIGDSISCGYGNEGASPKEHFSPATENAYLTYGTMTARTFGASYDCIAWSGRKLWPDRTMTEVYDRTLGRDPASRWGGDKQAPDAILINLCTNDFGAKEIPDHELWVSAYHDFLKRLRHDAPQAAIYCALSPMISDGYPAGRTSRTTAKEWIQQVVSETNAAGDKKVMYLEFALQQSADGIGADYHPSVKTNEIMSAKFAGALRADLKW